jgi:hypothetical protein
VASFSLRPASEEIILFWLNSLIFSEESLLGFEGILFVLEVCLLLQVTVLDILKVEDGLLDVVIVLHWMG